jgi:hypothetical protein
MKPPPVTPEEHAAFKAELPKLRQVVHKVRQQRLKYIERRELPPLQLVQELKAENAAALERLEYWDRVLHVESTREIRTPVRPWDAMNKVRSYSKLNETELDYYLERHARETV